MKKIIYIISGSLFLTTTACNDINTSTPRKDAAKINKAIDKAQTPEEIDEAYSLMQKYRQTYEEEIRSGERKEKDLDDLFFYIWE